MEQSPKPISVLVDPATDGVGGIAGSDLREEKRTAKLLRRCANEAWPVDGKTKRLAVKRMRGVLRVEAVDEADVLSVLKCHTAAAMALVAMDKVNQADRHLEEKYARIDEGKATDAVTPIVYKGVDAGDV